MSLLAVQLRRHFSFEDDVQLLLSAFALVVIFNKRLATLGRHKEVRSAGPPSETVGTAAISLTVQRAMTGA
jgi:hypothetical protein